MLCLEDQCGLHGMREIIADLFTRNLFYIPLRLFMGFVQVYIKIIYENTSMPPSFQYQVLI